MVNETKERFEDVLNSFGRRLKKSTLIYEDGFVLQNLAHNMLLRFDEVRKSRDKWKAECYKLRTALKESTHSEVKDDK